MDDGTAVRAGGTTSADHDDVIEEIVTQLADANDVPPLDLEPLGRSIDGDALERLLDGDAVTRIAFEHAGCSVSVDGTGEVYVTRRD